jgi:hypothetical protein
MPRRGDRPGLRRRLRERDRSLAVLFAGFPPAVPSARGVALRAGGAVPQGAPFAAYERALQEAAIRTPAAMTQLATIDATRPEVTVTTFRPLYSPLATGEQTLGGDLWVSLPHELKAAGTGAREPTLALQQIPGLPPTSAPRRIHEPKVRPADMFRPCRAARIRAPPPARSISRSSPRRRRKTILLPAIRSRARGGPTTGTRSRPRMSGSRSSSSARARPSR